MGVYKTAKTVGTSSIYTAMWVTYTIETEMEYCIDHKTQSKLNE
jgi:hypothetical protein